MEQFSLEKYLENSERKIVTRDGQKVRILCTDRKHRAGYPIIALVENDKGDECIENFTIGGSWWGDGLKGNFDLFFAPNKKEGWINLYKRNERTEVGNVYSTKDEAKKGRKLGDDTFITTIKIEWEE